MNAMFVAGNSDNWKHQCPPGPPSPIPRAPVPGGDGDPAAGLGESPGQRPPEVPAPDDGDAGAVLDDPVVVGGRERAGAAGLAHLILQLSPFVMRIMVGVETSVAV